MHSIATCSRLLLLLLVVPLTLICLTATNACDRQAREGHGGGFNERQDRASVATVEVDADGYDDFGRKKIKALADKKAKEVL